ncbi:hypothetical protein PQR02_18120 [Paraburkholderia sediminicola]|uniref:Uncharacterized protein n=1 Tax=Paraburkholderia rhynchosiae TaxID=487049 RepID=A0ACC7N9L3_9BURK
MPLPEPELSASLCFSSEIGHPRWMTESIVAEKLMFAHTIHEFIWTHAKSVIGIAPAPQQRVALSELQHAVRKAVVQGQRDKEIAYSSGCRRITSTITCAVCGSCSSCAIACN